MASRHRRWYSAGDLFAAGGVAHNEINWMVELVCEYRCQRLRGGRGIASSQVEDHAEAIGLADFYFLELCVAACEPSCGLSLQRRLLLFSRHEIGACEG